MNDSDNLSRFLFEHTAIRGNLIHLDASWRAILANHEYPDGVRALLGQAMAAVALLGATIKFDGSLVLQAQGRGPLRTLVAQVTHERTIRGLAHWEGEIPTAGGLAECFGSGHLVLTVERREAEPYQGVVPLEGGSLTDAIERYFRDSEQLPTRLWLAADDTRAAGLLLQRLPGEGDDEEDWNRVGMLAATITPSELLQLSRHKLLHRLFHEEQVRLFDAEPIAFRCGCSRTRIADTVRLLGEDEVNALLDEQGVVQVTCEFCNREYRLDQVDVRHLFAADTRHQPPLQHH